jgi:hypothetical protein
LVHSDHLNSHGLVTANSKFLWDKKWSSRFEIERIIFPQENEMVWK